MSGGRCTAAAVDAAVEAMWLSHITALDHDDPGLYAMVRRWSVLHNPEQEARQKETVAGLDEARARRAKLEHAFYVEGQLSEERFAALSADQAAVIDALEGEAKELAAEADLTVFFSDGDTLAEAWHEAPLDDRRMFLSRVLKSLALKPARARGDRTPILDRLAPEWIA